MTKRLPRLLTALTLPLLLIGTLIFVSDIRAGGLTICPTGCDYPTIQEAVSIGPDNMPMNIEAGTFSENVTITRSVTLVGAGPDLTIIDGQMTDTVILINDGPTVSISGVTIQNGDTTGAEGGGGLLNLDGTVNLTDVIVEENRASFGAGIANNGTMILDDVIVRNNLADELFEGDFVCADCTGGGISNRGTMTITNDSLIANNSANYGGGIDNESSGVLTILNNVIIEQNAARGVASSQDEPSAGGGIANLGEATIANSIVRNNEAVVGAGLLNEATITLSSSDVYGNVTDPQGKGGGIHNTFNLTVQTSNIYDNDAGSGGGGGISSEGGNVIVAQTAVYNNHASGFGGGILHNVLAGSNAFTIANSTISGNSTSGSGGGIRNAGVANTSLNNVTLSNNSSIVAAGQSVSVVGGTLSAQNSIINGPNLGGSRTNCSGTVSSMGYNMANDSTCGLNGTGDLSNSNPLLGPLQNNGGGTLTHALLVGSPAIDSGSGCPAIDQRGVARPFGAACDRGAYEFNVNTQSVYLPVVLRP